MKKLFTLFLSFCVVNVFAQTTLYTQNFNTGSASDWSLQTSDMSGTTSLSDNQWTINNSYAGGTLSGIIPVAATPDEPSGITGYPESYYMHIFSAMGVSLGGPNNSNFDAGGTGETYFAALNTPISTIGYSNVTFSFWWIGQGDASCVGKVYYKTSATGSWTQITTPIPTFYGSSSWNKDSVHLTAFDGQATLYFGFQFTDGSSTGSDPAFAVDDIKVTGVSGSLPTFTTNPANTTVCVGGSALFTGTASGATSYQWQRSTTGTGGTFVNITAGMDGGIYGSSYTTSTLTITSPTVTENGYAYQLIATNASGSVTSTPATLTVNTASAGAITGSNSLCIGSTITLSDATTGGTWSSMNANATVSTGGVVTGVAAGTDVISYTVSGPCGTATTTFGITVTTGASAGLITGSSTVCVGSTDTLHDAVSGGVWTSLNGNATVSSTGVVTGVTSGTDVISYTVSTSCGVATATFNLTITTEATAGTITGPDSVCVNSTISLSDAVGGGVWTSMNGNATVVAASGLVTGVTAGTDVVTYTVTEMCGSTVYATYPITIDPIPHPVIVRTGHTLSTASTYSSYQWSLGGTNITGATNSTFVFTVTGTYQVRVDSGGCYDTSTGHIYNLEVNQQMIENNSFGIFQLGEMPVVCATYPLTESMNVAVYDATGRTLYNEMWMTGGTSKAIENTYFANGLYIIRLSNEKKIAVLKWIKH